MSPLENILQAVPDHKPMAQTCLTGRFRNPNKNDDLRVPCASADSFTLRAKAVFLALPSSRSLAKFALCSSLAD